MVPPPAPRERRLRRRPAADRERADHFPTAHCRIDDRSARAAAPRSRARDRHRLRLPDLLVEAEERFRRLGLSNVETRLGDGAAGWPEHAPFQGIIVTAAAPSVPTPLTEQLAPGGCLVSLLGGFDSHG